MKVTVRTMTLADVQKDDNPSVYVLNKSKGPEKGQIIIAVAKENGNGEDLLIIPRTFIPVDITAQISKEQLIKSTEFRKALNTRQLVIINPEDAQIILDTKEAQTEAERIYQSTQANRNSAIDLGDVATTEVDGTFSDALTQRGVHGDEITFNQARILQIFNVLEEDNNQDSAISSILNMDDLTKDDLKYIYKKCDKKFKKVRAWAKSRREQVK